MSSRKRIHLCLARMSESGEERKYIQEAFDTHWVAPLGANVDGFEEDLKQFLGGEREVLCLVSGTAAVHLGLLLAGVGPGDEVLVQSFTFCASANPVIYLGATPVFVDSESDTWNLDPDLLEKAIESRIAATGRKPKAIVPVSLYGMPYKMDRILEIARRYDIAVVEDSAEGLGSRYRGRNLGTFGRFGVLSFNGNKMITTSGGGALICPDAETKRKALCFATQSREAFPFYQHESIGYNYRLSNICAGIGRGQMSVLESNIAHHKRVQKLYEELLAGVPGICVHSQPATGEYDSNYWLCTVTLDPALRVAGQERAYAGIPRLACQPNDNVEALRLAMDAAGVEVRPLWKPMHLQPVFAACPSFVNGVSEAIFRTGMCLPAGPCVSEDDVRYIVDSIKNAIVG